MIDPHPASSSTAYLSAQEILTRLALGTLTSLELVDAYLERIAAIDAPGTAIALNSITAVSADARSVATERDEERARGVIRGPLHGVPVVIKDNIEAVGLPGM